MRPRPRRTAGEPSGARGRRGAAMSCTGSAGLCRTKPRLTQRMHATRARVPAAFPSAMHPCAPCGFRRDRTASHACQRAVRAHCAFFYLSGHIARSCLQRVLVPRWQHAHRVRRTAGEADCVAQTMQVVGDPRTAGTTLWWSRGFRQAADPAADAQYNFKKFGTYSARRPGASASSAG